VDVSQTTKLREHLPTSSSLPLYHTCPHRQVSRYTILGVLLDVTQQWTLAHIVKSPAIPYLPTSSSLPLYHTWCPLRRYSTMDTCPHRQVSRYTILGVLLDVTQQWTLCTDHVKDWYKLVCMYLLYVATPVDSVMHSIYCGSSKYRFQPVLPLTPLTDRAQ
jgi:hypothetical protein